MRKPFLLQLPIVGVHYSESTICPIKPNLLGLMGHPAKWKLILEQMVPTLQFAQSSHGEDIDGDCALHCRAASPQL